MLCFEANREASTPIYTPPGFAPLPDRGPVESPQNHNDKSDGEVAPEQQHDINPSAVCYTCISATLIDAMSSRT